MLGLRQQGGGHPEFNEGSLRPEGTAVSGEDWRAYRERLQVRRGDYRHFLCEGQARQERQARLRREVFGRKVREAAHALAELQVHGRCMRSCMGSEPQSPTRVLVLVRSSLCREDMALHTSPSLDSRHLPPYTLQPPYPPPPHLPLLPPGSCLPTTFQLSVIILVGLPSLLWLLY